MDNILTILCTEKMPRLVPNLKKRLGKMLAGDASWLVKKSCIVWCLTNQSGLLQSGCGRRRAGRSAHSPLGQSGHQVKIYNFVSAAFPVSEFIDPVFAENMPKTLVFNLWKRAFGLVFAKIWVYKFGTGITSVNSGLRSFSGEHALILKFVSARVLTAMESGILVKKMQTFM